MSKTIEEIKDEYAHETSAHGWFDMTMLQGPIRNAQVDEVAERYAQSQTQELKEQTAELVSFLQFLSRKGGLGLDVHAKIDNLLTKYNHLKSADGSIHTNEKGQEG